VPIGRLTALGAALLLSGIIGVLVTLVVALLVIDDDGTGAGITGLPGILATLFLSYLVEGYAAGRRLCWSSWFCPGSEEGERPTAHRLRRNE
jgi:hypothetical protein